MHLIDPQEAFDYAIKRGMTNPQDYMYMYSTETTHEFKHRDTRQYLHVEVTG